MAEPWRSALQDEITTYTQSHYRHGACSVFGKSQGGTVIFLNLIKPGLFENDRYEQKMVYSFIR